MKGFEWHDLCCIVERLALTKPTSQLIHYAAGYARAGKHITGTEAKRAQAQYILNNLGGWKGPEARQVKAKLREFLK